jgi:hypothetical protein
MTRQTDQETLDRETECVRLRRGGLTLDEIAKRVGYANPGSVHKALQRANARIIRDDIEQIRALEEDRLDTLQEANWGKAMQGDFQAGTLVLRIMDRRAKLLGLDMPFKQEVVVTNATDDDSLRFWLDQWTTTTSGEGTDSGSGPEMVASSDGPGETGTTSTGGQLE